MIKTQIQVPEKLFNEIREFAKAREWSLAETFRRGAELLLEVYPTATETQEAWKVPSSDRVGWLGLSAEEMRQRTFDDADPELK
jgi:hypothetical protein